MFQDLFVAVLVMSAIAYLIWIRRSQVLASSTITVTTPNLSRERLEEIFVATIGNGGRDRWATFEDRVASQPNHLRWTLALRFIQHDGIGQPVLVAQTTHESAYFIPFPKQAPMWQAIEHWDQQARRMRAFIAAVKRADSDAEIDLRPEMFS